MRRRGCRTVRTRCLRRRSARWVRLGAHIGRRWERRSRCALGLRHGWWGRPGDVVCGGRHAGCGRRGSCGRRDRLILAAGISRRYWNSGNRRNCAPRRCGRERCRMLVDSRRRRRKPDGSRRFFRSLSSVRIGIGRLSLRDRRPRRRGPRWRCLRRGCLSGLLLPPRVPAFLMGRLISLVVPMGSCWRRSIRGCKAGGILRTRRAGAQASAGQHGERRCSQKMRSCLCHHEVPTPFQWRAQSSRRIRREYVKYPPTP